MIDEKKMEEAADNYAGRYFGLPWSLQMGACIFKLGIKWFLCNLWHDGREIPKDGLILVEYCENSKNFVVLKQAKNYHFPMTLSLSVGSTLLIC